MFFEEVDSVIETPRQWPGEPPEYGSEQTNSFVLTPVFETNVLDWQVTTPIDAGNVTNFWSATLTNRTGIYLPTENSVAATSGSIFVSTTDTEVYGIFSCSGPGFTVTNGKFRVSITPAIVE